ncbi:integration host factor subunit alpha [Bacteroidales bacterium]|nr:integration host factor subunit alpha [Bacteroidales bacterium]
MNDKIKLQEFISLLSERAKISKKDADLFLREFFNLMSEGLLTSQELKIKNLGTFKLSDVSERESVNVRTGERVLIGAHTKVSFSPALSLSAKVNEPFSLFDSVPIDEGSSEEVEQKSLVEDYFDSFPGEEKDSNTDFEVDLVSEVGESDHDKDENYDSLFGSFSAYRNSKNPGADKEVPAVEEVVEETVYIAKSLEPENLEITKKAEKADLKVEAVVEDPIIEKEQDKEKSEVFDARRAKRDEDIPFSDVGAENYENYPAFPEPARFPLVNIILTCMILFFGFVSVVLFQYIRHGGVNTGFPFAENFIDGFVLNSQEGGLVMESYLTSTEVPLLESETSPLEEVYESSKESEALLQRDSLTAALAVADALRRGEDMKEAQQDILKGEKELARETPKVSHEQQNSKEKMRTLEQGESLRIIALEEYGNKVFWVYIYEENKDQLKNPNHVSVGVKLRIAPAAKYGIDKNSAKSIEKAKAQVNKLLE